MLPALPNSIGCDEAAGQDCGLAVAWGIKAKCHANLSAVSTEVHLDQWWWTLCLPHCLFMGLFWLCVVYLVCKISLQVLVCLLAACLVVCYMWLMWLWFVCIPVWFLCVCKCVESVCVSGVFYWVRWGRVYRVGPSRAWISDLRIPESPLITSVCCFATEKPLPHLSWLRPSSFLSPHLSVVPVSLDFNLTLSWSTHV